MKRRPRRRPGEAKRRATRFVVITGMSGAGKSQAIRALEDLGYYCVDNLPITFIPAFAELTLSGEGDARRAAVVVDVREGRSLTMFPAVYRQLRQRFGNAIRLVFLEAGDTSLLRRFSETRRPHPLATGRTVSDAIREERRVLSSVRQLADQILDTSALNVHELRRRILTSAGGTRTAGAMMVTVQSFAFRRGVPPEADLVFDVRFLPNPHFVATLRQLTGRHARVARYVLRARPSQRFLRLTSALLQFLVPQYVAEGKAYLTVAIGCTGGRHRSVAIAEALGRSLKKSPNIELRVHHRDVAES